MIPGVSHLRLTCGDYLLSQRINGLLLAQSAVADRILRGDMACPRQGTDRPRAELWFLRFRASIEIVPVMTLDDLSRAEPAIKEAVKKYGG